MVSVKGEAFCDDGISGAIPFYLCLEMVTGRIFSLSVMFWAQARVELLVDFVVEVDSNAFACRS